MCSACSTGWNAFGRGLRPGLLLLMLLELLERDRDRAPFDSFSCHNQPRRFGMCSALLIAQWRFLMHVHPVSNSVLDICTT